MEAEAEAGHTSFFEDAIRVTSIDSHSYSAIVRPDWCIGPVPLGGYTTSILYRATSVHFKTTHGSRYKSSPPEPTTLYISFLNRAVVGPAVIQVQDVKLAGRISTVHLTLSQLKDEFRSALSASATAESDVAFLVQNQDKLEVKQVAYITASPPETETGPSVTGPWGLHPPPPPGSQADGSVDFPALARNSRDGEWSRYVYPAWASALAQLEIYSHGPPVAAASTGATVATRAQRQVDQWVRFKPGGKLGRWTNEAVILLLDIYPVATDRMAALELSRLSSLGRVRDTSIETLPVEDLFRVPTITMTIDLRTRLPPAGVEWLYTRVTNRMIRGGRGDVDLVAVDQEGELIALCTQTALVVDVARRFGRQPSEEKL
ncbi:thioesterase-like superfamily-domain-containing protein [Aspergillus crustosus]